MPSRKQPPPTPTAHEDAMRDGFATVVKQEFSWGVVDDGSERRVVFRVVHDDGNWEVSVPTDVAAAGKGIAAAIGQRTGERMRRALGAGDLDRTKSGLIIVVDANALLNIMFQDQPAYSDGQRALAKIREWRLVIAVPMHVLFEIECMMMRKNQLERGMAAGSPALSEESPLWFLPVAIDEIFVKRYRDPSLPYIKAGDFMYMAMAKREAAPLITEDGRLYRAARRAGMQVVRLREFADLDFDGVLDLLKNARR